MKYKVIEFPVPSKKEKIGSTILVLLFLSSFVSVLFTDKILPFTLFGATFFYMLLLNVLTNRKFDITYIIKKSTKYIEFNKIGFNYSGKIIEWEKLKKIKISIKTYKGKSRRYNYFGYGVNFIEYEFEGTKKKHFFYIKKRGNYLLLKEYFKTTVLPIIYRFKNITNENILIDKLEYRELQEFKQEYDIKAVYDEIHFN